VNTKIPLRKIDYAIYHNPRLISTLFKDTSIPKGLLYSRLRRAVPHKVGIEFEGMGEFIRPWVNDHKHLLKTDKLTDDSVAKYFGVESIKCDHALNDRFGSTIINTNELEEVRVCIKDFTQLRGLYNVMEEMKNYITIPKGGGIHIHIDMRRYIPSHCFNRKIIKQYLTAHIQDIEKIFPRYRGDYNKRRIGDCSKGTYLNLSGHDTFEFRIAPLTLDYETLIEWIVKCSKLCSEVIKRCHIKFYGKNAMKDGNREELFSTDNANDELTTRGSTDSATTIFSAWTELPTDRRRSLFNQITNSYIEVNNDGSYYVFPY
jgi:hypothetical protein